MGPVIGITGQSMEKGLKGVVKGCYIDQGYFQSVEELGGTPVILPPVLREGARWELLQRLDALLISDEDMSHQTGRPAADAQLQPQGYQEKFSVSADSLPPYVSPTDELLRNALQLKSFPILGIGKGMERINGILGGTCSVQGRSLGKLSTATPLFHKVHLQRQSNLYRMIQREYICVQATLGKEILSAGTGLLINARSQDGRILGVESVEDRFLLGIQWHPEKSAPVEKGNDVYSRRIFECFVQQAQLFAQQKQW